VAFRGEPGDVINDLSGNQDPIPGRLIGDTDTVEEPGSVGNTDLCPDSFRFESDEEGVKTAAMLVPEPRHVTVT
jgi:hypothetical protein